MELLLGPGKWVMIAKDDERIPCIDLEDVCSGERVFSLDTTKRRVFSCTPQLASDTCV